MGKRSGSGGPCLEALGLGELDMGPLHDWLGVYICLKLEVGTQIRKAVSYEPSLAIWH